MEPLEVARIKRLCRAHSVSYDTFQARIKRGFTEEEALKGMVIKCEVCGAEFRTFARTNKYCSDDCRRVIHNIENQTYRKRRKERDVTYENSGLKKDIERGAGNLEEIYNRPLTCDTKYLVNLWYSQGDSPEDIAYILRRPVSVIQGLLINKNITN